MDPIKLKILARFSRQQVFNLVALAAMLVISLDQQAMIESAPESSLDSSPIVKADKDAGYNFRSEPLATVPRTWIGHNLTANHTDSDLTNELGHKNYLISSTTNRPEVSTLEPIVPASPDPSATTDEPTDANKFSADRVALVYLQKYGYYNSTKVDNAYIGSKEFYEAMIKFQDSMGLKQTGILDEDSIKLMSLPRCGNLEMPKVPKLDKAMRKKIPRRRKRQAMNDTFTYKISRYPSKYNDKRDLVDEQVKKAFNVWSKPTGFEFVEKKDGVADIDLEFSPDNQAREAFLSFPHPSAYLHFDDDKSLTIDSDGKGIDLFQKVVHGLGHGLGLRHSNIRDAVMYPLYKYKSNFTLHSSDVEAIRKLYFMSE